MKNKIPEYRSIHNFTQAELAQKVGVCRETIIYLEKNKYIPSLKLAYDIAKIFNTSIENVFYFK